MVLTYTPKQLVSVGYINNTNQTVYTTPVSTVTILQRVTFSNPTGGAVTVDAWIVPNGDTATDANHIVNSKSIAAGASWNALPLEAHILDAADLLVVKASAASSINLIVSGIEAA